MYSRYRVRKFCELRELSGDGVGDLAAVEASVFDENLVCVHARHDDARQ